MLFQEEFGVADFLDLHPAQHLTNNHFDVLVVNVHTLQAIDLLNFVRQVFLQTIHAQHAQNVVRVERTILKSFAGPDSITLLYVDVRAARDIVLALFTVVAGDDEFALTL